MVSMIDFWYLDEGFGGVKRKCKRVEEEEVVELVVVEVMDVGEEMKYVSK